MRDAPPDWKGVVRQRLAALGVDATLHLAVVEELAQHLDERHQSLMSRGLSAADAEQSVLQELDDEALQRELLRAERAMPPAPVIIGDDARAGVLSNTWQDLRYAARALRKSPGFTMVATITLALGVGVNTAIFSVVNAVMLRPLPYAEPDRLIRIWESNPEGGWPQFAASHPNFLDWRAESRRFETVAASAFTSFSMTSSEGAEIVRGNAVTKDFLPLLGTTVALGRNFLPEEDRVGGNTRVVILADAFWRRRFGADPTVLGGQLALNGASYTVIGVLPATFDWGDDLDVLVPLAPDPARNRGDHRLLTYGRLAPGATIEEAHTELAAIAARLATQFPDSNKGWTVRLATFDDWIVPEQTRDSLQMLLIAVAFVMLIACGNVANLLLARGAVRQKELTIRVALGAERWRILRQLLAESFCLSLLAAAGGLVLGLTACRLLVAFGPDAVPRLDEVSFDRNVLVFVAAMSIASTFVFGLVPAIQLSGQRPADALRESSRGSSGGRGRQRLRSALTIAEVALSVTLLIGAGLLLRSFARLQQVEAGFEIEPLMTLRTNLPRTTYTTGAQMSAFYERLLNDTRRLPGVAGVATSSCVPLSPCNTSMGVRLLHRQAAPGETPSADWRLVSPGYFATMGIPLRGRDFAMSDRANTLLVTVISEAMARRYWPNQDPIGQTVVLRSFGEDPHTIIGVAGDVRSAGLDTDPAPMVYGSAIAYGGWNPMNVVWRSAVDPASHVASMRDTVRSIDPSVPVYDVERLSDLLDQSFGPRRLNMYLLGIFATVAVALAAIGLFGVMAYLVSQRTREIGVRLALGAARADVFRLVVGRGVALASLGAALGVVAAFWLTRLMENLLFSVSRTDPGTFVAVPLAIILVAVVACYVPARRAMRVDPVTALRGD